MRTAFRPSYRALLRDTFPEAVAGSDQGIHFSFDMDGWRCVGLDSHGPGQVAGRLCDGELDWLRDRLHHHPGVQVVACGHVHREFTVPVSPHTCMVTTPSTGLQFDPAGEQASFEAAPAGYRVFEFTAGHYRTWVERLRRVTYSPEPQDAAREQN